MRIRLLAATLMAIAIAGVTASPAVAAPVATKSLCKSGGFAGYVDPATGAPFASQDGCVSFVNRGGTLVSVATPAVQLTCTAVFFVDTDHPNGGTEYQIGAALTGFAPGSTVTLQTTVVSPTGEVSGPFSAVYTIAPTGALTATGLAGVIGLGFQASITATDGDVTVSTPSTPVAC